MIQQIFSILGIFAFSGMLIVVLAAWFTHLDVSRFRNDVENIAMDEVIIETIKSDVERMLSNEKDLKKREALEEVIDLLNVRYEQNSIKKKIV